jgi:hypothetical protein
MNECSYHRGRRQKALGKLTKTEFWNMQRDASRLNCQPQESAKTLAVRLSAGGWTTIAPAAGSQFLVRPWSGSPQAMDAYGWTRLRPQQFIGRSSLPAWLKRRAVAESASGPGQC